MANDRKSKQPPRLGFLPTTVEEWDRLLIARAAAARREASWKRIRRRRWTRPDRGAAGMPPLGAV